MRVVLEIRPLCSDVYAEYSQGLFVFSTLHFSSALSIPAGCSSPESKAVNRVGRLHSSHHLERKAKVFLREDGDDGSNASPCAIILAAGSPSPEHSFYPTSTEPPFPLLVDGSDGEVRGFPVPLATPESIFFSEQRNQTSSMCSPSPPDT